MALEKRARNVKRIRKNAIVRFLTHKVALAVMIFLLIVLVSGITALAVYTRDNGKIVPGVSVGGVNVGNMTKASAQAELKQKIQSIQSHKVTFDLEGKTIVSTLNDLGLSLTDNTALNQAYAVGHEGNLFERVEQKRAALKGINYDLKIVWDKKKLAEALEKMFKPYEVPAHDASFTITPSNAMVISKESDGKGIDVAALASQVQKLDITKQENTLTVAFQEEKPKLTAAILEKEKITGLLASYTTNFDPNQTDRTENVRLAADALNGAVIAPGEMFSFNKRVGERTAGKGYQDAYIIVNGQFVEGLGGGICQVSSTLYNTALLADLPIDERINHDLVISYVPLGQDATVAWPNLDLKFSNNSGGYILIRTILGEDSLTINFYGQPQPGRQVIIKDSSTPIPPPEQKVTDKSLPSGQQRVKQEGVQGYHVTTTRTIVQNGKVVKTDVLGTSTYEPTPEIIEVGPDK
jgi:vancomycin resistance protein YoaR